MPIKLRMLCMCVRCMARGHGPLGVRVPRRDGCRRCRRRAAAPLYVLCIAQHPEPVSTTYAVPGCFSIILLVQVRRVVLVPHAVRRCARARTHTHNELHSLFFSSFVARSADSGLGRVGPGLDPSLTGPPTLSVPRNGLSRKKCAKSTNACEQLW